MGIRHCPRNVMLLCLLASLAVWSGCRQPGQTKVVALDNGATMEMVWISAGNFMMGSPSSEEARDPDEQQQQVTISRGFWLGKYEVTQAQWETVMGSNPSHFHGDDLPVDQVRWTDCQEFIERVNVKGGGRFRLPTEAEWEYACRAGTTTPFHFGATISTDQANYKGTVTYGNGTKGEFRGEPTPVGSFPANAWGSTICMGTSGNGVRISLRRMPHTVPARIRAARNPALRTRIAEAVGVTPRGIVDQRIVAAAWRPRRGTTWAFACSCRPSSGLIHADGSLFSAMRARPTFSMIRSAVAVHTKGFGS